MIYEHLAEAQPSVKRFIRSNENGDYFHFDIRFSIGSILECALQELHVGLGDVSDANIKKVLEALKPHFDEASTNCKTFDKILLARERDNTP